jgi:pentatricopeptide repeat protein
MVETALIDMYAKCKKIYLSFRVFAKTTKKRTVPWNAILSGCIHNGLAREGIEFFKQMLMNAVQPNDATLNSLLPAYSILTDLQQATNIHCYLVRYGFLSSIEVVTGLIDIYSKCGSLESAYKIFSGVPEKDKDIVLRSVNIASYRRNGKPIHA